MLNVEDWAEIRRLHRAESVSIKEIVRRNRAGPQHGEVGRAVGFAAEL